MNTELGALAGYTIAVTADRRADEQIELLERRGARVVHGPTIRTLPLDDDAVLDRVTRSLIDRPPDHVVLTTAIGVRSWHAWAESNDLGRPLHTALSQATVITRGPKARGAAVTLDLEVAWSAPGSRIAEVVHHLSSVAEPGSRVALQLDGGTNADIADDLTGRGFDVVPVSAYRWTLPVDLGAADRVVTAICDRTVDAVTVTASPALRNLFELAARSGRLDAMTANLGPGAVDVICVGPACVEAAADLGIAATISPTQPRLGAMVQSYAASVAPRSSSLELAGVSVVVQGRAAFIDGQVEVKLSDRERDVLAVLARRPGRVVSKATLVREVWDNHEGDEHVVEVTVGRLRRRLGPAGAGIETVVRRGYRLDAEPAAGLH